MNYQNVLCDFAGSFVVLADPFKCFMTLPSTCSFPSKWIFFFLANPKNGIWL